MDKAASDAWFASNVLPLERDLTRFLSRKMRRDDDLRDLRQEIYARVYEAVSRRGTPSNPKAFVFTAARNLLIDRARRQRIISMEYVAELEALIPVDDLTATERHLSARQELRRLQVILEDLPPRCREVVRLRKIEQLSQKDTALRMGVTEDTIERQLGKGVRILADRLFGAEVVEDATVSKIQGRKGVRRDAI